MTFSSIIEAVRRREVGYKISKKCLRFFEKRKSDLKIFADSYTFEDRQIGSENLLMVVLGFQPFYWDVVLDRVNRNVNQFGEPIDVCLCVPCGANDKMGGVIREFANKYSFSYLYIEEDLLAQVQNTAIKLHPNAKWIFKIDEDIILCDDYFAKMKNAYRRASKDSLYEIGYISPILNINDYGTRVFLKSLNCMDEYKEKFGDYKIRGDRSLIFQSGEVAKWVWSKSIPFDEVAETIYSINRDKYSISNIRVRIGSIMHTRLFWEQLGGYRVAGIGNLGYEELQICEYCMNAMCKIVVAEDIFCGHLGFSKQKDICRQFFNEHNNEIRHK